MRMRLCIALGLLTLSSLSDAKMISFRHKATATSVLTTTISSDDSQQISVGRTTLFASGKSPRASFFSEGGFGPIASFKSAQELLASLSVDDKRIVEGSEAWKRLAPRYERVMKEFEGWSRAHPMTQHFALSTVTYYDDDLQNREVQCKGATTKKEVEALLSDASVRLLPRILSDDNPFEAKQTGVRRYFEIKTMASIGHAIGEVSYYADERPEHEVAWKRLEAACASSIAEARAKIARTAADAEKKQLAEEAAEEKRKRALESLPLSEFDIEGVEYVDGAGHGEFYREEFSLRRSDDGPIFVHYVRHRAVPTLIGGGHPKGARHFDEFSIFAGTEGEAIFRAAKRLLPRTPARSDADQNDSGTSYTIRLSSKKYGGSATYRTADRTLDALYRRLIERARKSAP